MLGTPLLASAWALPPCFEAQNRGNFPHSAPYLLTCTPVTPAARESRVVTRLRSGVRSGFGKQPSGSRIAAGGV